jgi:Asp/Glu/hydantoin racemase
MPARLVLIHTVPTLVDTFAKLAPETVGDQAKIVHVVDETLLQDTIANGSLSPAVSRRVAAQVFGAEDSGATAILVTCSSIGAAVEAARPFCSVPLLRVDEAMIDRSLELGSRIGAIGTLSTTLEPTADLIRRRAAANGKEVEVVPHLCEGAFDSLRAGDLDEHDRRVRDGLREVIARTDVVVLAQASMARVADQLDDSERGSVEILSSPRSSMERAAVVLSDNQQP